MFENAKSLVRAAALSVLAFAAVAPSGEAVPFLQELRPPAVEKKAEADDKPVVPDNVDPARRVADPARLVPDGAAWCFAAADLSRTAADWDESPVGRLLGEPATAAMLRNNRFGLEQLFGDLPRATVSRDKIVAASAAFDLARALAKGAASACAAGYADADGSLSFLFVIDIGLDRLSPFGTLVEWETNFFVTHPAMDVERGDHSGNFLDRWALRSGAGQTRRAEVAAGFAENMAVIATDASLAAAALDLLSGGRSLADSERGRRLAAAAADGADVAGFIRMDAILTNLAENPSASAAAGRWADLVGHGGGEALFYGVKAAPDGFRETYLLPLSDAPASAALAELLARRLKPSGHWESALAVPYQPSPVLFAAAMLDGRQLAGLLRQERRLFGTTGTTSAFDLPPAVQRLFTPDLGSVLTGEAGAAFFTRVNRPADWLLILPCSANPAAKLPKPVSTVERSGASVLSASGEWRDNPSWTVVSPPLFRRLEGHVLLIASRGEVLETALEQGVSGTSFADNKDFKRALAELEPDPGFIFYFNLPEVLVREYPLLSGAVRSFYPRSSGLNSRPPLTVLRKYARGMAGAATPAEAEGGFVRFTVRGPAPSLGVAAADSILGFPRSLRDAGRKAMEKSRENMQTLWLRLQLYANRHGSFPESLDDLAADLRQTMTRDEVRDLLTAPAALARYSPEEAARLSYRYLGGAVPTDEPDLPIIYEAEPWNEDFAGMYPSDASKAPSESGDFQPYRQFIQLGGQVVTTPEKTFQAKVAPRLAERE